MDQSLTSEVTEILTESEFQEAKKIMSEEEILMAVACGIREGLIAKRTEIKTIEYNKKLSQPVQKPIVSTEQFFTWVINKGKNEIKNFSLAEEETKIYRLLSMYFTGDKEFEKLGYSLDKGLMLYGGVGCGKTTIMKLFKDNPVQPFGIVECMRVADQYKDKEGGSDIVHSYSIIPSACFNDLGTDIESGESSHYGNKKNVMREIILSNYERNNEKKFKFHFTTNLNADKQEEYYGIRIRSRLREMCNIISLAGIADKRK